MPGSTRGRASLFWRLTHLAVVVEMDYGPDLPSVVHQHNVPADYDVSVAPRCLSEVPGQVARYRVRPPPKTAVERCALTKTGFLVGRELVFISETPRRIVPMLVVPISSGLLVPLVKPIMLLLAISIVPLPLLFGKSRGARQDEQCRRRNR